MNLWQWILSILRDVIEVIYGLVHSHGWSIVLFTVLIKVLMLPLDMKSRRSMRRMNELNPKIQALQVKYANDKEKLQQKQAELYRKEKINPLASCLPMLLTLPVLFAMFAVMRNVATEELTKWLLSLQTIVGTETTQNGVYMALDSARAAGGLQFESWLWIKNLWMADSPFATLLPLSDMDLATLHVITDVIDQEGLEALKAFVVSDVYQTHVLQYFNAVPIPGATMNLIIAQLQIYRTPNGFFLLPILAAVTQYLSTILTPQQATTEQSKSSGQMMKVFMPLFSVWICSTSNAAFSLYWVVANVFQIVQQLGLDWYFKREDRVKALKAGEATK